MRLKLLRRKQKSVNLLAYHPRSQLAVPETVLTQGAFPAVDAHLHLGPRYPGEPFEERYDPELLARGLEKAGILLGVDLELFSWESFRRVRRHTAGYEQYFRFCAPVDLQGFEEPDFERKVEEQLLRAAEAPEICGIKIWKDLGMELRGKEGRLAKLTDECFSPLWKQAGKLGLPVVLHVADPPAFFEPADLRNERLPELIRYPMWSYADRKELSFLGLLSQQEELVLRYPDTVFVIAHMGSWASNLDYVEGLLASHPNVYVDTAAVLSEIGRQPRRFRALAEKFPERILFGTDLFGGDPLPYSYYYRFLETEDEYFPYGPDESAQGFWRIYGCGLPKELLKKLYLENAKQVFHLEIKT